MKKEDPKAWWREMKRFSGGNVSSGDLINHINVKEVEKLFTHELANSINKAFLEPLEEYRLFRPITRLALEKNLPEFLEVSEKRVLKILSKLNPFKSCGPDRIPNWLLREYADLIAFPVCRILQSNVYLIHGNWLTQPRFLRRKPVQVLKI